MKKIIFFIALIIISLVGCYFLSGYADDFIDDSVIRSAKINDEEDYINYKILAESDQLDSQGLYVEDSSEREIEHTEKIHVTFADNGFLDISYFYDEKREQIINPRDCWLNPGDTVYYKAPVCNNKKTDLDVFAGFKAFDLAENGQLTKSINLDTANLSFVIL